MASTKLCCRPAHRQHLCPVRHQGSNSISWRTRTQPTPQRLFIPRCSPEDHKPESLGNGTGSAPELSQLPSTSGPSFQAGINWYCYCVIGLIFITDFTPLGLLIKSSAGADGATAGLWLAALQWGAFVAPTLWLVKQQGWDLKQTLRLQPASPGLVTASVFAGALLWTAIAWALAAKSGVSFLSPSQGAALPEGQSVLGGLVSAPSDTMQWAQLMATVAASPAIAEELLFRGFFLTAIMQRLGRIDAVCVVGALFAVSHLDPQQFFSLSMLGFAAGGLAVASGSVLPAAALHFGYNAAALVAGALLAR